MRKQFDKPSLIQAFRKQYNSYIEIQYEYTGKLCSYTLTWKKAVYLLFQQMFPKQSMLTFSS